MEASGASVHAVARGPGVWETVAPLTVCRGGAGREGALISVRLGARVEVPSPGPPKEWRLLPVLPAASCPLGATAHTWSLL